LDEEERITIVVPTLNEARNISTVINELQNSGFANILIIDGNSRDKTVEIARGMGINVLDQVGKGKGSALRQAFEYDGISQYVIMMDADGSMDPREIPSFIEALRNGSDVVKGSRFMPGGRSEDMTSIRRLGNKIFVHLANIIHGAKYTDLCYGYAAFRKDALHKLQPHLKSTGFEIETELFIKAKKLGLKVTEVPSIEYQRKNGQSNLNAARDGLKILKTILKGIYFKPTA
jgi:glycosyltransferase involved in cell wall biosynthesis